MLLIVCTSLEDDAESKKHNATAVIEQLKTVNSLNFLEYVPEDLVDDSPIKCQNSVDPRQGER